jgi:alpha 1,2-mannosyltransferase
MDFWRGPAYSAFFQYLEATGGFYYEVYMRFIYDTRILTCVQRWGDAPVHSIAAGIFLPRNQIHFFDEIGYEHPP